MSSEQLITIDLNGEATSLPIASHSPLVRAVIISLFTWRRANTDDTLPDTSGNLMGWWGDTFATVANDRIGSRLWLLIRAKLTDETVSLAKTYAQEALEWLVQDGVAARVDVEAERVGVDSLGIVCRVYKEDGKKLIDIRFNDLWSYL